VNPANGLVQTFLTLAVLYAVVMSLGAWVVRVPAADWKPAGFVPATQAEGMRTNANVTAASAIRTPQFWLLWVILFCNVTAGIGILEQASPMIQDFFSDVDAKAAAGFVGLLSLCNMGGRFIWSSTSDLIGRRNIYVVYLGVGALLYLILAFSGTSSIALFVITAGAIISFYGGGFATVPAYLKDMFGGLQVGAIHGRLLTAWSAAGIAGPLVVNRIADHQAAAGRSGSDLYGLSLKIMVGVLIVGFVANMLVKPVDERFHEPTAKTPSTKPVSTAATPLETA
jgi:MFS family permease